MRLVSLVMQEELRSLNAENLCPQKESPTPSQKLTGASPDGENALGWVVKIYCRADGMFHEGQLIAYKADAQQHHVLYKDGEDEWIQLQQEALEWLHKLDRPQHAGLKDGEN